MTVPPTTVRAFRSRPAEPEHRGVDFGRAHPVEIRRTFGAYRELWGAFGVGEDDVREVGEAVLDPVRTFSPSLYAELIGIATGSGLEPWQLGALNARTELLARGDAWLGECTTCVRIPRDGGPPTTVQTWDWHDALADSWFVWTLEHPHGRVVHTLTEYGILGKIGVASSGVSVHFNALRHRSDDGSGGVPVHLVARRILDKAADVDDAVRIAEEAKVSASASITVTGRRAQGWAAVAIELHPAGPALVGGHEDGGEYLVHTNHFLGGIPLEEQVIRPSATTHERFTQLTAAVRPTDAQPLVTLLARHRGGPGDPCVHLDPSAPTGERVATLAIVATQPAAGTLAVHAGRPCQVGQESWYSPTPVDR